MDDVDLVVVGAGPAGAAAAIAARQANPDLRVLLLDRADFPRDKACGDGIAPEAVDVLGALDATDVLTGYRPVRRLRVQAPSGVAAERPLLRPDWVIPRRVFDARLVAVAERAGAERYRHCVRRVEQRTSGVVLDNEIRASHVVAADGANSVVRRALGIPANPPDRLAVAVRGYARAPDHVQTIVMRREHWPSYAWRFPVGDGTANVGYGALRSRFDGSRSHLLARMDDALGGTAVDPATIRGHALPFSSWRPRPASGRVLLAGDAASLINPLSGEGIFYALASGLLAGRAVAGAQAPAGDRYEAALDALLRRHHRHTRLLAWALRRPWLAESGVAAAAASQRAFDDLCDLTLGCGHVTPTLAAGVLTRLPGSAVAVPHG